MLKVLGLIPVPHQKKGKRNYILALGFTLRESQYSQFAYLLGSFALK
jgi:hypothetical protein